MTAVRKVRHAKMRKCGKEGMSDRNCRLHGRTTKPAFLAATVGVVASRKGGGGDGSDDVQLFGLVWASTGANRHQTT